MENFPKAYSPHDVEEKWYKTWSDNDLFKADNKTDKETYSILMPPPNVTGILHFGHVLNMTLQDLFIRRKRMQGYEVCWFPGTDHAGIATQTKVEAHLRKDGISRYDLGREKFIDKVWEWRDKYGGIILKQMKKLGVSCDWDRTLFTMDESASNAVREVFIRLFDDGLIYRGKRIINWSPLAQTALSDEEVEFKEVNEHLYTLKYYFEDSDDYLKIATVRTETIFGDIAVAVNPEDERYKDMIGKKVRVPLVNRLVPVIPDEHADPEFGTGCVKITPAHDPNDFMVGERHDLKTINTINADGTLNENTGEFNGLDRFEARKKITQKLKELDLIEKTEDYAHNVGFSQRGGEPIEPFLSDQWFVKMEPLAEQALKVVENDKVNFHPNHWVKTYEHWMKNIRDWCISRQLWWGHRIPVYYTEDGKYTAANNEEEARKKLNLPQDAQLKQDEDVLDTWFSSWLWPLTTMRWKHDGESETTPDLEKFLPTDLLVTAPDIIFFWVARMIMATTKFKQEIPFKDVYFTSTIRDGLGRKLSKSLGNSPDPLNIIDKYGTDAVRFTIIYLSPLGQDVKMDVDVKKQDVPAVEIGRNFANKVWNAGRFLAFKADQYGFELNNIIENEQQINFGDLSIADQWILSKFNSTIADLDKYLDNFKVTEYSKLLYDFIWSDFCDWYIEIVKVQLNENNDKEYQKELLGFALKLYEDILKLLHPVTPFITEEIWHILGNRDNNISINNETVPVSESKLIKSEVELNFNKLQAIVEEIRRLRSTTSIPPSQKLPVVISCNDENFKQLIESQIPVINTLANCENTKIGVELEKPEGSLASVVQNIQVYLIIGDAIDIDKEKERINKEIQRLEKNINGTEKKLSNEKFVNNAPEQVVQKERDKLNGMKDALVEVKDNLNNLG